MYHIFIVFEVLIDTCVYFFPAVQHERAPRQITSQHQLALQKLSYSLARQPSFFPSPSPVGLTNFPHYQYGSLSDRTHNFLENPAFQTFPRPPDPMSMDISNLGPLFNSSNPLNPLNPFKIPLFPAPMHYSVPHSRYISTNIFYPPIMSPENNTALHVDNQSKYSFVVLYNT